MVVYRSGFLCFGGLATASRGQRSLMSNSILSCSRFLYATKHAGAFEFLGQTHVWLLVWIKPRRLIRTNWFEPIIGVPPHLVTGVSHDNRCLYRRGDSDTARGG